MNLISLFLVLPVTAKQPESVALNLRRNEPGSAMFTMGSASVALISPWKPLSSHHETQFTLKSSDWKTYGLVTRE